MNMNWLYDTAFAMASPNGGGGDVGFIDFVFPFALMFAVLYFLVIRPQKRQADTHRKFLGALQKGDEVVTSGGIFGKVAGIADQMITLEVAEKVKIKVTRSSVHPYKRPDPKTNNVTEVRSAAK